MAEEVQIGNVGGDGVASEVTLQRLVQATEAMAKSQALIAKVRLQSYRSYIIKKLKVLLMQLKNKQTQLKIKQMLLKMLHKKQINLQLH